MFAALRQAFNSWKSAKGVALLAILALAIGIGSATAIYTVVHAVLLKPLPYQNGDRFVALYGADPSDPNHYGGVSNSYFSDFSQRQRSFDVFGWFCVSSFNLTAPGQPQHVDGVRVTPTMLNALGVKPRLGRWFREAAKESGNSNLAVISYRLWQRLGANSDLIGRSLVLDGQTYVVTGVAPEWFHLPLYDILGQANQVDIWIPISPQFARSAGEDGLFLGYARRKSNIGMELARQDVNRVSKELAKTHPAQFARVTAGIRDLREITNFGIKPTLLMLLAAAALLLVITCANVSGLLVTRAMSRSRETAIRLALGAGQAQVILQYFAEGLIVALIGATLGVLVSYALIRLVLSLAADTIPFADEIALDWSVITFAVFTAILVSLLTSLAPLWHAMDTAPHEVLSDGTRASAGLRSRRLSRALVVCEIALAFTLLAVSALFLAQLRKLNQTSPGFDPNHLLTFQLRTTDPRYTDTQRKAISYQNQLVASVQTAPGILDAALVSHVPLAGCCYTTLIYPEGRTMPPHTNLDISFQVVSPNYFHLMGIPLTAGRYLTASDTGNSPGSIVINEAAAKHFWNRPDATSAFGRVDEPDLQRSRVVGVVADVKNGTLNNGTMPEMYVSSTLAPMDWMSMVVRSNLPKMALVPVVRAAIHRINPTQPIYDIRTVNEIAQDSLTLERATSLLTAFFACAALLLTALGVYGVVAYSVRQRTVEFGTRMALGAVSRDLLKLVLGNGLKMAMGGLLLGGLAVYATTALLLKSAVLHSVEPLPFVYSTAAIAALALLASVYPAWRATQLTPMVAIRNEPETMWLRTREQLQRVTLAFRPREDAGPEISESTLLAGFVDATRRAETSGNALESALASLCETLGAQSAVLLETIEDNQLRCVASLPASLALSNLTNHDGFLFRRLRFYSLPLPLSQADYVSWLRWAAEHRPEYVAELSALQHAEIRLAVALRTTRENIGLLLLGPPRDGETYGPSARRALRTCADQLALMLENSRLTGRVVEQEKLRRDVALAIEVQKRLLPEAYPESSYGDVAAFTLPARSVGGDYYDFIKVGDHGLGIALADVAGKGVAAALIMSVVQASLRILTAEGNVTLPELVSKMNRFLHRSTGFNSYATFFYAQLDEENGQLSYVNAGHNPPYLLRAAEVEELSTGGMVIGMFAQASYEEAKVDLQSGDVLVAFTDGVTEALNIGEEEYGEERLKELLKNVAHLPVGDMSTRITKALREWIGDAPQHDDLTFLVFKVK